MSRTLDRTKDIFLDTMLLGNEILIKRIKISGKTKITVVLAAFRSISRLRDVLANVFNQTMQEFEVIIIDDSTEQKIEEFIANHDNSKINYIKKQLGSNAVAKNCALEFAKGEYVIFLEENINFEKNYFEKLYFSANNNSLDIAVATRKNYNIVLENKVTTGVHYLTTEIKMFKNDIDYNLTSCLFKKKFLDVYNLQFQEDMLALENLYFKLKTFDLAMKVCQSDKCSYRELTEQKTVRNQAMISASTRRIMNATERIEVFKKGKKYEESLNLLCGYLWLDVLRMYDNMEEEVELVQLIKTKKHYFATDSFINKMLLNISPIVFASHLNRKERG
ncbi:glycosyltransferase, group 2 family protein [Gemella bergeri ATCC 700627]|uniref:Glycosyltransferase, group 2 family protein n=1 Tax=Gemella bergeri ATCC 700627 TaxID=1321820 RepID=U2RZK2_9BACL|nr:glycosyltransferase family 2 protein [Gemella bergeri]ERK56027.1 glycosyltransferase, group 2 family protein [Gemella bergeri ATCC 700627]